MASNVKLTKAQMELLVDLERSGEVGRITAEYYAPAKKLVVVGMATWGHTTFGATYLRITPAGLEALREVEGR